MAKRDNAPIGNTCPMIDKAISHIDSVLSFVNEDEITDAKYHIDNANSYLEDIRTANATLRDWGNDMSDQRDELEDENNDLENLLTQAKDEIATLKEEIDSLNYDIKVVEGIVVNLYSLEQKIKDFVAVSQYFPIKSFTGKTECFTLDLETITLEQVLSMME